MEKVNEKARVLTPREPRTFAEIVGQMTTLQVKKNHDYGNAFSNLFQRKESYRKGAGLEYASSRIFEKASRVENLAYKPGQVNDESVIDTLIDIAAYCIMTVQELEKIKDDEE